MVIGDRPSPRGGRRAAARLDCEVSMDDRVFPVQQYEPGVDKFLFHQLRGDLVQLPSFQSKRSKRPETQVEIFETLPSNSIRECMIL